jgi:hypothetical protein
LRRKSFPSSSSKSNAERIGKLERNYREYTAELRRRYSLESQESANSTISGSDAATSMLSNTSVVIAGSP